MRLSRLLTAAVLLSVASPAVACELDGPDGHRFFAFAGMYRGGPGEPAPDDQARKSEAPAEEPGSEPEQDQPNEGSTGSDDSSSSDPADHR